MMMRSHSVARILGATAAGSGGHGVTSAVWISITALALSMATFAVTFVTSAIREKRLLLLRLHEYLTAVDQQNGRREIYRMAEQGKAVTDLTDEQYTLCNHALAALNSMAIYYKRRYIPRDAPMEFWAETILHLMPAAQPFLEHRDATRPLSGQMWPELREFTEAARKYATKHGLASEDPGSMAASAAIYTGEEETANRP